MQVDQVYVPQPDGNSFPRTSVDWVPFRFQQWERHEIILLASRNASLLWDQVWGTGNTLPPLWQGPTYTRFDMEAWLRDGNSDLYAIDPVHCFALAVLDKSVEL